MPPRVDPYKNFQFRIEIDGLQIAGFSECTGLESSVDVIEYREGGDFRIRKLPGLRRFGNVTLKRGVTNSGELQEWHKRILQGELDRRNVVIILLDDTFQEVVRWVLSEAFPRRWEGPNLNARSSDVAIEAIELCCESIERES